jgi:basic membrane protein A
MFKKVLSIALAAVMVLSMALVFTSCGSTNSSSTDDSTTGNTDVKVGVILVGDETEGYTLAHINGIKAAAEKLGLSDDNIVWKYKVEEDQSCTDAATDLVGQGCNLIFANSYGHETYLEMAAEENPDVTFVSMTGDFAAICGLSNYKNAFTNVYESRYVSGVVAGMKLKELVDNGELTKKKIPDAFDKDGNIKVGYVGAYNYAEVVSGYTAFYLGIKSVIENVVMEVNYTNSWFSIEKEGAAAEALMANGCVIIGQHADSTGASAAVEKKAKAGATVFSVGYNIDMRDTAPTAALTSATNNWEVYYEYAIGAAMKGEEIKTDWSEGYDTGAVAITDLGDCAAEGTAEKVEEVEAALKDGSLHVFDTANFTVDGKKVTTSEIDLSYYDYSGDTPKVVYQGETKEAITDGYFSESTLRSAPYFSLRIDGITEDK